MADRREADAQLVVEERFAIVPEWLLDADIGDCAVRLYAVLLRYGNSSGARMPGRATLARRLRKKSTDTVDRAMRELVAVGAVRVEHRFAGRQRLTNRYHVRTSRPRSPNNVGEVPSGGGRADTATGSGDGRSGSVAAATGGRKDAPRVAATTGEDREHSTQSIHPPPPPGAPVRSWEHRRQDLLRDCGVADWAALVADVQALRAQAGCSTGRWREQQLLASIDLAVRGRGWPAQQVPRALRHIAADPISRSPGRLAEAGPWWDQPPAIGYTEDLDRMSAELDEADGRRVALQREARAQLAAEGMPLNRVSVLRRAHALLRAQAQEAPA
ncbi:MAG TPA: hypothetical protein VNP20_08435 [Nocardioidaceae bacterium]|nr:hypothetical protein [Nocardioidaceae bacterium]